jgi:cell wall-associated NlpC family hydrolase
MLNLSNSARVAIAGVVLTSSLAFSAEPKSATPAQGASLSALDGQLHRRPLNRREGAALRDFTLAQPADLEPKPDCSHLMHQIFTAAGLDYSYANSFQLFTGVPEFRRVKSPQAGDLIVWRGHVGLVIDPVAHSFYSSLGSGIQTDQYDNRYWRRRGRPRFYRYLTDTSDKAVLLAARARLPRQPAATAPDRLLAELNASTEAATGQISSSEVSDASAATPAGSSGALAAAGSSTPSAENFHAPENIQIASSGATPSREEIAQALSELTNASGGVLREPSLSQLPQPVTIFEQLKVEKFKLKHDDGWAEVTVRSRLELAGGKVNSKARSEKRRWQLLRTNQGWVALAPSDRVYVPADVGVQVLAEKLAVLSRDHKEDREQQASLARLLNTLLNSTE